MDGWKQKAAQMATQQAIGGDDAPLTTAWAWLADGLNRTNYNDGVPPEDMKDAVWINGKWYERTEPWPGETPDANKIPQTGSLF